jgi:hypothetical protein
MTVAFRTQRSGVKSRQSPSAGLFEWEECDYVHFQSFRQNYKFYVGNTAQLGFNFRECAATQFQSEHGAPSRKHLLRHLILITQFSDLRANQIFRFLLLSSRHAPETELDTSMKRLSNCSDIGARYVGCLRGALNKLKSRQIRHIVERLRSCGTY